MHGYEDSTYGDRIADVYDEWFPGVSDAGSVVRFIDDVAATRPSRILELAVGTGRLAVPLAGLGHDVTGVDISSAMLDRLRAADTEQLVTVVHGDMVDDLPDGPYDVAFVAYNSLFMLTDPARQAACFRAVHEVLAPGGAFIVKAFVPYDPPRPGTHTQVRSMTSDRVVLDVSVTDAEAQTVTAQVVDLADGQPVRLRPYRLRWSRPDELDGWATDAGLVLAERYENVDRDPFTDDSEFHVTIYRRS